MSESTIDITPTEGICDYCHETFTLKRSWQKFCCKEHNKLFWLSVFRKAGAAVRAGKM